MIKEKIQHWIKKKILQKLSSDVELCVKSRRLKNIYFTSTVPRILGEYFHSRSYVTLRLLCLVHSFLTMCFNSDPFVYVLQICMPVTLLSMCFKFACQWPYFTYAQAWSAPRNGVTSVPPSNLTQSSLLWMPFSTHAHNIKACASIYEYAYIVFFRSLLFIYELFG